VARTVNIYGLNSVKWQQNADIMAYALRSCFVFNMPVFKVVLLDVAFFLNSKMNFTFSRVLLAETWRMNLSRSVCERNIRNTRNRTTTQRR